MRTFLTTLALLAAFGLATAGLAHAGEDCCGGCDKAKAKAEQTVTATKSPIHSMMKWVAGRVAPDLDCGCPSTAAGEKAWRSWFAAKEGPLGDLRAAMVKDGWTADRTIGFFKAMAAHKSSGDCGHCDKSAAKTSGAAAPTGDAGTTGDAKGSGCCGGCDKSKAKASGCCGGCDKSKAKTSGAAAPTGDAGTKGDAKGDCCGGCDKAKSKSTGTATQTPIHTMMKWVGSQVAPDLDCACPSTEKGEMAWRAWYAAKDARLGGLRAAMVKDGWTADRTVAFFKAMASKKDCGSCDKDCGGCDKAGSEKAKTKTTGAAAPTGDAGTKGDSGKCPCTGKPIEDCGGCGKAKCPCGKKDKAPAGANG